MDYRYIAIKKLVDTNVAEGREWFIGLPLTYWHGNTRDQFIAELPVHLNEFSGYVSSDGKTVSYTPLFQGQSTLSAGFTPNDDVVVGEDDWELDDVDDVSLMEGGDLTPSYIREKGFIFQDDTWFSETMDGSLREVTDQEIEYIKSLMLGEGKLLDVTTPAVASSIALAGLGYGSVLGGVGALSSGVTAKLGALTGVTIKNINPLMLPAVFGLSYALTRVFGDFIIGTAQAVKDRLDPAHSSMEADRLSKLHGLVLNSTYMKGVSEDERIALWTEYCVLRQAFGMEPIPYPYEGVDSNLTEVDLGGFTGEYTDWQIYQMMLNEERYFGSRSLYNPYEYPEDREYYDELYDEFDDEDYFEGSDEEEEYFDEFEGDEGDFEEYEPERDYTKYKGEEEDMSYRRPYYNRNSYGQRTRSGVSVGRKYLFSRYPRPGYRRMSTRYGIRYVKPRRY